MGGFLLCADYPASFVLSLCSLLQPKLLCGSSVFRCHCVEAMINMLIVFMFVASTKVAVREFSFPPPLCGSHDQHAYCLYVRCFNQNCCAGVQFSAAIVWKP